MSESGPRPRRRPSDGRDARSAGRRPHARPARSGDLSSRRSAPGRTGCTRSSTLRTPATTRPAHVLAQALPRLSEAAGAEVTGSLGDAEPLMAIQDAINLGHYDEIIISTLPRRVSRWLQLDLVSKTKGLGLPVTHVDAAGWSRPSDAARGPIGCRRVRLATFKPRRSASSALAGQVGRRTRGGVRRRRVGGRRARAERPPSSVRTRGRWPTSSCWRRSPSPGTIYAIGLNYADHIAEMGDTAPEQPIVFVKVSGSRGPARRADRAARRSCAAWTTRARW